MATESKTPYVWQITNSTVKNGPGSVSSAYRKNGINQLNTTVLKNDGSNENISLYNVQGYEPVFYDSTSPIIKSLYFRVQTNGKIDYATVKDGKIERTYNTIQEFADSGVSGFTNQTSQEIKSQIHDKLKYYAKIQNVSSDTVPPSTDKPSGQSETTGVDNGRSSSGDGQDTSSPGSTAIFEVTSNDFRTETKFNSEFLKYPEDMNSQQDRIVIVQKQYVISSVLNEKSISTEKITSGAFGDDKSRFENFSKEDVLGTVVLPMPNDISETNVTAWGEDSLSSLAALVGGSALGAVQGITDFNLDSVIKQIETSAQTALGQGTAANETIKQLLSLNAAAAVTRKFGININPEAFRSRITGTAINPNLELLFQGPKLRSFGFQFKMTPRSWKEARNIRYIIKFFKKGMAPKRISKSPAGAYFLGTPNVFDIHFRSSQNDNLTWNNDLKSIGKIKTCALQQCLVNYTPDGFYAAFKDLNAGGSQPISVVIQLAFTELTPLYNENYNDSIDTAGWDELFDGPAGEPSSGNGAGGSSDQSGQQTTQVPPIVRSTDIPGDPSFRPPSPGGPLLPGV